jgi:5-hydroxyisourate hydrolase
VAEGRPTISTHVLDLERGLPAAGVPLELFWMDEGRMTRVVAAATDEDGRVRDLLEGSELRATYYELTFDADEYRTRMAGGPGFFIRITIGFEVTDTSRSYHVPLLLSPFGLSTYRGS